MCGSFTQGTLRQIGPRARIVLKGSHQKVEDDSLQAEVGGFIASFFSKIWRMCGSV